MLKKVYKSFIFNIWHNFFILVQFLSHDMQKLFMILFSEIEGYFLQARDIFINFAANLR